MRRRGRQPVGQAGAYGPCGLLMRRGFRAKQVGLQRGLVGGLFRQCCGHQTCRKPYPKTKPECAVHDVLSEVLEDGVVEVDEGEGAMLVGACLAED